ncbi:A/G-specific adenine glycosylase [Candidatus Woesearchaeota archaeon]|nr:A/G-specific adenine glycosylase [Candidatus Woesearchaeota archaeon]
MVSEAKIQAFQQKILSWYEQYQRDLPWRHTIDAYPILVSEIMLQQTQVDRVIPYYQQWMQRFPNIHMLAEAPKEEILRLWSGLGYNSRVLNLHQCAQAIVARHDGRIPEKEEVLLTLPGIGPYTARAILAFAFNKRVAVLDTNIRRVLIHEFKLSQEISLAALQALAYQLIPDRKSRLWHNALMDYGALVLTTKTTGIKPLSTQSPFKGSDRWVRGRIVKRLLEKKQLSVRDLQQEFEHEQLARVIMKMKQQKIIQQSGDMLQL